MGANPRLFGAKSAPSKPTSRGICHFSPPAHRPCFCHPFRLALSLGPPDPDANKSNKESRKKAENALVFVDLYLNSVIKLQPKSDFLDFTAKRFHLQSRFQPSQDGFHCRAKLRSLLFVAKNRQKRPKKPKNPTFQKFFSPKTHSRGANLAHFQKKISKNGLKFIS